MVVFLLNIIKSAVDIVTFFLFSIIIISSFFSENIRANLKSLISTLYENGLVGLAATLILISFLIPTFKFYYLLAKNRKINIQLIRSALTPSKSEKSFILIANFVFPFIAITPFLLYIFFGIYICFFGFCL